MSQHLGKTEAEFLNFGNSALLYVKEFTIKPYLVKQLIYLPLVAQIGTK